MQLQHNNLVIPHVEELFGVWSMHEPAFNALRQHAEALNIQVHLQNVSQPEVAAVIAAQAAAGAKPQPMGKIAVIPIEGTILKHVSSFSNGTSTVQTRRAIRSAVNDPEVSAIMLFVDSPGGTVKGIHDLADEINEAKKTKIVWAYVEDLAASAGYWIASQADRLIANPSAVLGSIGVFSVVVDYSRKAENEGVQVHVIKSGDFKGAAIPGTKVTDEQLAEFKRLTDSYYSDFIDAVASGRRISREAAVALADGRVHKGQANLDMKLADGLMSFDKAISELASVGSSTKNGTKQKASSMSQENNADAATVEPKAATIGELRAACAGASDGFILAQLEKKATINEAMAAWIQEQSAANAQLQKDKADAEKNAQKQAAEAGRARPGVKPLSEGGKGDEGNSAETEALTREHIAAEANRIRKERGCLMSEAFQIYFRDNEEARLVWLQSQPPARDSTTRRR